MFVGGEKNKGPKETRSEKRKRRYEHAKAKRAQEGDLDLNLTKEELRKLQEEDPLIQGLRKLRPDQVVEQVVEEETPTRTSGRATAVAQTIPSNCVQIGSLYSKCRAPWLRQDHQQNHSVILWANSVQRCC